MPKLIVLRQIVFCILLLISIEDVYSQSKKELNEVKNELNEFVFIENFVFAYNDGVAMSFTPIDSQAFSQVFTNEKEAECDEFFISNHEVTNKEYRDFVEYCKQEMISKNTYDSTLSQPKILYHYVDQNGQIKNVNIYPRTEKWESEHPHNVWEQMRQYYFDHQSYYEYPVLCVSYNQVQCYIHWLNKNFDVLLKSKNVNLENWGSFKIPTVEQWLSAANAPTRSPWLGYSQTHKMIYNWDGHDLRNDKGGYMANFGEVRDLNHTYLKSNYEDGHGYSSPVKNYEPNGIGLYDLSGNAAEWTSSSFSYDSIHQEYASFVKYGLQKESAELVNELLKEEPNWALFDDRIKNEPIAIWYNQFNKDNPWTLKGYLPFLKEVHRVQIHNEKALKIAGGTGKIVKGGSWNDAPCYLKIDAIMVYAPAQSSSTVGFRVVFEPSEELKVLLGTDFGMSKERLRINKKYGGPYEQSPKTGFVVKKKGQ